MGRECIEEDNKKKKNNNNNWGLQAIVHPPPPSMAKTTTTAAHDDDDDDDLLLFHTPNNFFDVSQVSTFGGDGVFVGFSSSDDALLEELYKPFYHHLPNSPSIYLSTREHEPEDRDDSGDHKMKGCYDESSPPKTPKSSSKYKKRNRKNEHNRVVIEVEAEELCKDKWAWRKYGQKPIKGSPYPRSYYRCSSSKGCLARKQVERSNSKAGTFVVTYTAEHSHSQPTRRNSLAGTIRNKFIILPPPATAAPATPPRLLIPSSASDPLSSSDYNSSACNEGGGMAVVRKEPETMKMEENIGEDFFAGLEDLEGLLSQFCYPSSSSSSSSSSSHDQYYYTSFTPSMFSS
ncbi:hypothetical protein DM860_005391 [Cuscuta australis]|uniref:WRKY domain-containing protein n=1 Tax=Cuscuta australis TaxID=267555 RepID=A0A328DZ71_9ASTE|nr:hypothetical protein DM860_005391 [Cuscuta australis]